MKKPEPWPVTVLRRCGAPDPLSGEPKRRKNCSKGDPGGNGRSWPLRPEFSALPSILTRTETTAGFTFSTMSAKPTGRATCCACCVRFCACAAKRSALGAKLGAMTKAAALNPAIVVARSANRRAESTPRGLGEKFPLINRLQIGVVRRRGICRDGRCTTHHLLNAMMGRIALQRSDGGIKVS